MTGIARKERVDLADAIEALDVICDSPPEGLTDSELRHIRRSRVQAVEMKVRAVAIALSKREEPVAPVYRDPTKVDPVKLPIAGPGASRERCRGGCSRGGEGPACGKEGCEG